MSAPDFSVVIVNWNGREFLRACLESLRENARDASVEPIVVDNGSEDGTAEAVRAPSSCRRAGISATCPPTTWDCATRPGATPCT